MEKQDKKQGCCVIALVIILILTIAIVFCGYTLYKSALSLIPTLEEEETLSLEEIEAIGQNSRGAKTRKSSSGGDYYGFIRGTNCPAVIVECAFLDNKKDVQIIDTKAEQKAMGVAVAKGFLKTLKVPYKAPQTNSDEAELVSTLYRVQVGAFSKKANAERKMEAVKAAGFDAFLTCMDDTLWRVQIGAFAVKANADKMLEKVIAAGFSGYVTKVSGRVVK